MMLKAALPSATSLPASCHVSDAASEFVYESSVLYRLSASLTPGFDQSAPFLHNAAQRFGPIVEIITVSRRCLDVHSCPIASGMTPPAFALFRAAMNWAHVFGGEVIPAFRRTFGLNQRMLARWMLTGTEYRCPLYLIWLSSWLGIFAPKPYCL